MTVSWLSLLCWTMIIWYRVIRRQRSTWHWVESNRRHLSHLNGTSSSLFTPSRWHFLYRMLIPVDRSVLHVDLWTFERPLDPMPIPTTCYGYFLYSISFAYFDHLSNYREIEINEAAILMRQIENYPTPSVNLNGEFRSRDESNFVPSNNVPKRNETIIDPFGVSLSRSVSPV